MSHLPGPEIDPEILSKLHMLLGVCVECGGELKAVGDMCRMWGGHWILLGMCVRYGEYWIMLGLCLRGDTEFTILWIWPMC